jgi:hypothetical protein
MSPKPQDKAGESGHVTADALLGDAGRKRSARLERVLLSLTDVSLRVDWLRAMLPRWPAPDTARLLNALCEENERGEPSAREALIPVSMLLAAMGGSPLVERLREQAKSQSLLGLERLLRRPPDEPGRVQPDPSARPPKAAAVQQPVPDYGRGRELTLGERRSLARRPNRKAFEKLLADPHPLVIRQLLGNPRLTEDDVVRLVARRPARLEVLLELVQTSWLSRSRVRLALVLNPGTPASMAMPLLALCTRGELLEVLRGADTSSLLRATAHELIERRPPLEDHGEPTLQ